MKKITLLFTTAIFLFSCQVETKKELKSIKTIVCTTGMLGDAVKNIVDSEVKVITLMGPGVDPHLYKATQGDLKYLTDADVIVYNGLHLEGKMGEIFEKLAKQKHIIVAAEGVSENEYINNTDFQGAYDPHLWFDVKLWSDVVRHIGKNLSEISESSAANIDEKTEKYVNQLITLDGAVNKNLRGLPENKRILITAHDAFSYFGRAYGFQVKGLQGISTTSEYGLKDVSDLVSFIVENEINAVFVESSVSQKSLEAVVEGCIQQGHEVVIGGQLYSDAMGKDDTPDGTYIGMVKHNVKTIIKGLK